jgi:hypothetical protein
LTKDEVDQCFIASLVQMLGSLMLHHDPRAALFQGYVIVKALVVFWCVFGQCRFASGVHRMPGSPSVVADVRDCAAC